MQDNKETKPLKLDLGCGKNKISPDFTGVDSLAFEGVDVVLNLAEEKPKSKVFQYNDISEEAVAIFKKWIWEDNSVDEVHCSHFIEHLRPSQRIHFVNELHRVLKPGAKATIIVPHWASCRAYGDLSHAMPPVSEFWFYYLSKDWRAVNAPHNTGYTCNFSCSWGFSLHQSVQPRNQEYQTYALSFYKEAAQDIIATFIKV